MKFCQILAASLLALPTVWSQTAAPRPVQYIQVACLHAAPGVTRAAIEKFHEDFELKRFQHLVNSGTVSGWRFERNVLPGGKDADCDFRAITTYFDFPPEASSGVFAESLRAAGIPLAAPDYYAKRASYTQLTRLALYSADGGAGANSAKGDFVIANMVKIKPGRTAAYRKEVRELWLPYYTEKAKQGAIGGAYFGSDLFANPSAPYNAYLNRIYREWKSLADDSPTPSAWEKANPGKDLASATGRLREMAPITVRNVYRIQWKTEPKQPARQTSSGR